jgi:hypothetical protein
VERLLHGEERAGDVAVEGVGVVLAGDLAERGELPAAALVKSTSRPAPWSVITSKTRSRSFGSLTSPRIPVAAEPIEATASSSRA